MKQMKIVGAVLLSLATLTACGPGQVVVVAEVERLNPETGEREMGPVANMQIQLIPFDRDAIFDSLSNAASTPEPVLPEEVRILRDSAAVARTQWSEAEAQWNAMLDRQRQIVAEMERYNNAAPRYRQLFEEFNQAAAAYERAGRVKDQAFDRFTSLNDRSFGDVEQYKVRLEAWEEDAFADWGEVVAARLDATGKEILYDTTEAGGRAQIAAPKGEWWVHGRYAAGTEELYWNVPTTVGGDPVEVRLTRENADVRPIF
jgi:hypothetical protein